MATVSPLPRNMPLVADLPAGQTIKLIGAGGIGAIVARYGLIYLVYLAELLGRQARYVLIDGDAFEARNRSRGFYTDGNKAAVLCDEMCEFALESPVTLSAVEEFVTPDNISRLLHEEDIILLAVDNNATRKLVSDYCEKRLKTFCLISAGNDGIGEEPDGRFLRGTFGNCQIFARGKYTSPSLTQYHPELASPTDRLPTELNCTEILVSQPQNLLANLAAASSMLNALWLYLCDSLHYSELAFDIADGVMRPSSLPVPKAQIVVSPEQIDQLIS